MKLLFFLSKGNKLIHVFNVLFEKLYLKLKKFLSDNLFQVPNYINDNSNVLQCHYIFITLCARIFKHLNFLNLMSL